MSKNANPIDALVAELAPVRDDELVSEVQRSGAALLQRIVASPVAGRERGRGGRRRVRLIVVVAVLAIAALLSLPALGVMHEIAGLVGGDDDVKPVPTAPEIVVASGDAGIAWRIVAVTSDHGLCLGAYAKDPIEGWVGNARCDYVDLHGDLPPDVRGNPSRPCLATPTDVVPCGTLPRHWIDFVQTTDPNPYYTGPGKDLTRMIVFGLAAADVARVDLVLTNGETVRARLVEQPEGLGAPLNFYWAALPLDDGYRRSEEIVEPFEMVIARDSAGGVLERRVAAWNGNPTGDPDGPPPPTPLGE